MARTEGGHSRWRKAAVRSIAIAGGLLCFLFAATSCISLLGGTESAADYFNSFAMAWDRGGLAWAASEAGYFFAEFSVGAIVIFVVQVPFLLANAALDRVSESGSQPGVWLRAIVRSFVFALIVVLPLFAMVAYEVLYVPPGQGILNSDQIGAPLTLDQKRREVIADLKILPIQIVLLAAIAMIVQAPFALARRS